MKHLTEWHVVYRNKSGKILSEFTKDNFLTNLGEKQVLLALFRGETVPDIYQVGLFYGTLFEESTIIQVPNEPSGNGYSREVLQRQSSDFPIIALDEGDYVLYTKTITITALGGNIGPVDGAFMSSVDEDDIEVLFSVMSMPTNITINNGESLEFTIKIKAM